MSVCALLYVFCLTYITSDRFARVPGRFAESSADEFPFVKARAMRIATSGREDGPYRVVLIGDSAISEALTSSQNLQKRIEHKVGRRIEFTPLLAGGLNQLEAVDLCAMMRGHMRGEVILQMSPYNLALVLNRETYDKAVTSVGMDTQDMAGEFPFAGLPRPRLSHNFFLRNRDFLLARSSAFARFLRPLPEPPLHLRMKQRDATIARFQRDAIHSYMDTKGMHTKAPPNVEIYKRIIQRLQASGITVVLLESPMNPRLTNLRAANAGIGPAEKKAYREARAQLIADTGTPFWDFSKRAKLVSKDFIDYIHIRRAPARVRFTQLLADRIAGSLPVGKHKAAA